MNAATAPTESDAQITNRRCTRRDATMQAEPVPLTNHTTTDGVRYCLLTDQYRARTTGLRAGPVVGSRRRADR